MTPVGHQRALVSWSASMFEYLMPLLIMRTLSAHAARRNVRRRRRAARSSTPKGSACRGAFRSRPTTCRTRAGTINIARSASRASASSAVSPTTSSIAPYASLLAAPLRPKEVLENLEHLASEGALGPMGYYEAIDYTPDRLEPGQRRAVVKTYMAHHQGMSLVALNNCLNGNIMQARFHAEPRVQAAELLLQERSPHLVPLDRPPDEHKVEETRRTGRCRRSCADTSRRTPSRRERICCPTARYSVMVTNAGGGYSRWRDLAVTRWREDCDVRRLGQLLLHPRSRDAGEFWSSGFQPSGREADQLRSHVRAGSRRHAPPRRRASRPSPKSPCRRKMMRRFAASR